MKMTKGPTDPTTVIDYTDWEDVKAYAKHCLTLAAPEKAIGKESTKHSDRPTATVTAETKTPKKPRDSRAKTATGSNPETKPVESKTKRKSTAKPSKKTAPKRAVAEPEKNAS